MSHVGRCFCGAVEVEATGAPEAMGYCHCNSCRSWSASPHVMSGHQPVGLVDVYAATIPTLKFEPAVHVNYGEAVLRIKDGLPKMKDFPADLGGSGEMLPE